MAAAPLLSVVVAVHKTVVQPPAPPRRPISTIFADAGSLNANAMARTANSRRLRLFCPKEKQWPKTCSCDGAFR